MTRDKVENLLDDLKNEYSSEPENQFHETRSSVQEDTWDSDPGTGNDREWFEGKPSGSDSNFSDTQDHNSISRNGSLTGGGTGSSDAFHADERLENSPEWSKDFTLNFSRSKPNTGKGCKTRSRVDPKRGKEERIVLTIEDGNASVHIFSKEV